MSSLSACSRSITDGSCKVYLMAAEIFSTMGSGVNGGATMAVQVVAWKPGTSDSIVGTCGIAGDRVFVPMPSTLTFPACHNGKVVASASNTTSTWPDITAESAGAAP